MQTESGFTDESRENSAICWALAVVFMAILLRFVRLGSGFLQPEESALAAASLSVAKGQGITPLVPWPGDALFFGLNALTFFLGAVSNFWARFWPALFGSATVALPFLLPSSNERERLRNLIFALLMTFSPSFVFWSRHIDGSMGAAFGALAFLVFLIKGGRRYRYAAGMALAILLLSGRSGVIYLVSAGIVGAWLLSQKEYEHLRKELFSDLKPLILPAVVVYALVSTSGFSFLPGFGIGANGIATWFQEFFKPGQITWWWAGLHLVLDEPLIIAAAAIALFDKEIWESPRPSLLFSWSFIALMLMLWQVGRSPGDIVAILLPLAWIGSESLSGVVASPDFRSKLSDWYYYIPLLSTEVVLFFYLGITLAMYTQLRQPGMLLLSLAGVLILCSVVVFSYTYAGIRGAVQVLLASTMTMLFLYSIHLGVGLSIDRNPLRYEAYVPRAVSADFQAVLDQVEAESFHKVGDEHLIPIDVIGVEPQVRWVLLWALRDFDNARFLDVIPESPAKIIITPDSKEWGKKLGDYSGQEIAVLEIWSPAGLRGSQLLRWIQLRERGNPDAVLKIALWVSHR